MSILSTIGAIVGSISGSINIFRFLNEQAATGNPPESHYAKSHAARFVMLFEAHGIHRNEIPSFFGHGLTLPNCVTDEELTKHLDENMIQEAAKLFAVNPQWLLCASDVIYHTYKFYKSPKKCYELIKQLTSSGNDLNGYVITSNKSLAQTSSDCAIVFLETIREFNDKSIKRLYVCGGWKNSYWRSRAYLASCVSIALDNNIWLMGKQAKNVWLESFSEGLRLPSESYNEHGISMPLSNWWEVDELVTNPEAYLAGISPETNKFGLTSALNMWLALESKGQMQLNKLGDKYKIRQAFEQHRV